MKNSLFKIALEGSDEVSLISDKLQILHGTSARVKRKAAKVLNEEFDIHPRRDEDYWDQRNRKLYYIVLQSPVDSLIYSPDPGFHVLCAARLELTDYNQPKYIVLDFIRTASRAKRQGHAAKVVNFVLEMQKYFACKIYVCSLPATIGYWTRFGFVKAISAQLDDEMNEFMDCCLMVPSKITW